MDEEDAVESLKRLGLSEYESKVFIALQKLGTGTARDIYRVTDVPRSQVYGAAESLEGRGLVEIQQSKPMQYRPVSLEEARSRLRDRFEKEQQQAFDYLENARQEYNTSEDEEKQEMWTVQGSETVNDRVKSLINEADERIVYAATHSSLMDKDIKNALLEKREEGIDVVIISEDRELQDELEGEDLHSLYPPENRQRKDEGGRVLFVDEDIVLLSVLGEEELPGVRQETAIWSASTAFASVLVQLTRGWLEDIIGG